MAGHESQTIEPDTSRRALRYRDDGGRDLRRDWLRGYAVLAMSSNHFGIDRSIFRPVTGGSVFLINAAEVFFFVSGLTLGLVSSRKPLADSVRRCYRRAWELYVAVFVLAAGAVAIEGAGHGEPWVFLGAVATLQEAPFWGDVLVSYVLFLLLVPAAIVALHAGRWGVVLGATTVVYVVSQVEPNGLGLPFASFRNLAANGPIFFGGLLIGWYREPIARWWSGVRWRALFDGVVIAIALLGVAFYIWGRSLFPWADAVLERFELGVREYEMPPEALAVVLVYLRCLWLLVDRLWGIVNPLIGWATRWIGRSALTAYVGHAFAMVVAWWVVGHLGVELDLESRWHATAFVLLYLAVLFAMVATCRCVMWLVRRASKRRDFTLLPAPVLVAALVAIGFAFGPLSDDDEWEGDWDGEWTELVVPVDEVAGYIYNELARHDTAAAALLVRVWWALPPDHDEATPERRGEEFDELAEIVGEAIGDELGRDWADATLTMASVGAEAWVQLGIARSLLERGVADGVPTRDPEVLLVLVPASTLEDGLDAVDQALERERSRNPDAMAIVLVVVSDD